MDSNEPHIEMTVAGQMESVLWCSIAAVVLYIGDGRSNLITIAMHDSRVHRMWLSAANGLVLCNTCVFLYLWRGVQCWKCGKTPEEMAPLLPKAGGLLLILSLIAYANAFWSVFHWKTCIVLPLLFFCLLFALDLIPGAPCDPVTPSKNRNAKDQSKQV